MSQFYSFTPLNGNEKPVSFDVLAGKVVLVVNVASLCGYTPQYQELEKLHRKYHSRGLIVLGFPCNQFANQEPNGNLSIALFCQKEYGVSFPIMNKIDVNGLRTEPLYRFLKKEVPGAMGFEGVRWNFEKFLVDRRGKPRHRFLLEVRPLAFEDVIVELLDEPTP